MFERHAAEQAELELAQARAAAAEAKAALAAAKAAPESGTEQVAPGCQTESCFFKCFFKWYFRKCFMYRLKYNLGAVEVTKSIVSNQSIIHYLMSLFSM